MFHDWAGGFPPVPIPVLLDHVFQGTCAQLATSLFTTMLVILPCIMATFGPSGRGPKLHSEQVSVDHLKPVKPTHVFPDEPVELARALQQGGPPKLSAVDVPVLNCFRADCRICMSE